MKLFKILIRNQIKRIIIDLLNLNNIVSRFYNKRKTMKHKKRGEKDSIYKIVKPI